MRFGLWIAILILANIAWNKNLWWVWCITIYLAIGAVIATHHLSSGKKGQKGIFATLIAVTLFWPLVWYQESKYR
jgi:hypothetical protein